jgi:hypothetical protein
VDREQLIEQTGRLGKAELKKLDDGLRLVVEL